jgi:hypothetical protein
MVTLDTIKKTVLETFNDSSIRGNINCKAAICILGTIYKYKSTDIGNFLKLNRVMISHYNKHYSDIKDKEFQLNLKICKNYLDCFKEEDWIISSGKL